MTSINSSELYHIVNGLLEEVRIIQQIAAFELEAGNMDAWSDENDQAAQLLKLICELQCVQFAGSPTGTFALTAA